MYSRRTGGVKNGALLLVLLTALSYFFSCEKLPSKIINKESPEVLLARLPNKIGNFEKGELTIFPERELGAGIQYFSPASEIQGGTILDFYLYDQGIQVIQEGVDSQVVIRSKKGAKKDIFKQEKIHPRYRNLKSEHDHVIDINIGTSSLKMLCVSYIGELVINSEYTIPCYTEIYITGYKNYVCKFRITRLPNTNELELRDMIATLLSFL